MNISKIEKLLQFCDLNELRTIEEIVADLIQQMESESAATSDEQGRKMRKDKRFVTNILGTLTRLTDVRPGERKEFSVMIQDISRNGMRMKVDTNFILSRLVQITFAGPGGKIKQSYMEVVRIRKMANEDESWLEIGCRSVNDEEARRIRLYEEQIARMRSKLHNKSSIIILVVGPLTDETERLITRIKSEGYQARQEDSPSLAIKVAERLMAQLAIFCSGTELLEDPATLETVLSGPARLAKLVLVENEEERLVLCQAGIDECLIKENCEAFLFQSIERALVGHIVRQKKLGQSLTGQALLVSEDNSKVNLVSFQLEEYGYNSKVVNQWDQALQFKPKDFELVLADFDQIHVEEFKQVREHFSTLPVIALCDEISQGQKAMATGATNYLCMPPNKDDMRMIMESCNSPAVVP